ncbi:hypothetical protein J6X96_01310 [bacterium]|nr:hypothetical protein [bacterium]
MHPHVTGSVFLAESIIEIEDLAKSQCWQNAADLAKKLSQNKVVNHSYFSNGEPVSMVLECMGAVYLSKITNDKNKIIYILNCVLDKYKDSAADKRYYCYKYAQQTLRSYYIKNNMSKESFELFKTCILYDPFDYCQMTRLINWGSENKKYIPKIVDFIYDLCQHGHTVPAEITLNLIINNSLDLETKIYLISKWLKYNLHQHSDVVCRSINEMYCITNSLNADLINKVHILLVDTALKQKNTDDRLSVIASSIKLKNILEEHLFNNKITINSNNTRFADSFSLNQSEWNHYLESKKFSSFDIFSINEMLRYLWSSEHRQRIGNRLSFGQVISASSEVSSFEKRIVDLNDNLYDCDRYKDLLLLQGVPGKLYWKVENLFWRAKYDKAYRLFKFLLNHENSDGFVKGASLFYLGRILFKLRNDQFDYDEEKRKKDALGFFLSVPSYPTCLTYISYAYIMASEILYEFNCFNSAMLLCMIDVPSIDYASVKQRKHRKAAEYALAAGSITNYVKNIQESLRFSNKEQEKFILQFNARKKISSDLWNYCCNNPLNELDKSETLNNSIDEMSIFEDSEIEAAFYYSVTKNWPNISDLPQNIATNRLLNNNIF